jgi:hypothetical protein
VIAYPFAVDRTPFSPTIPILFSLCETGFCTSSWYAKPVPGFVAKKTSLISKPVWETQKKSLA